MARGKKDNRHLLPADAMYVRSDVARQKYVAFLYVKQDARCAICSAEFPHSELLVDHDHGTGLVRGLLCRNCNIGLGNFLDSEHLLLKAIEYLRKSGRRVTLPAPDVAVSPLSGDPK